MKADISDAPERVVRGRPKGRAFRTVSCLVIVGSMATAGAFQLVKRAPHVDPTYTQSISPTGEKGVLVRAGAAPPRQDIQPSQLEASSSQLPAHATNTARQTVFDDKNFTPRGADNVVTFNVGSDPAPRKQPPAKMKLTIVRQSRSKKERVCWPYKQGSVEARNCRAFIGLRHRD